MTAKVTRASFASVVTLVALLLFPRRAFAHGEGILIAFFWWAAVIPWGVFVYGLCRSKISSRDIERSSLAPLILIAGFIAVAAMWFAFGPISDWGFDPSGLSPMALSITAAPAAWYLWRSGELGWALGIVSMPMVFAASCQVVSTP